MAAYLMTVEKFNGEKFSDTVAVMAAERDHLVKQFNLGELITSKRAEFEDMGPETYYFYEYGRIRVRKVNDQPRRR